MMESAIALSAKYDASLPDLHYHITDLLRRFSNKALGDTCARVGGDTVRKLGNKDRLIGALLCSAGEDVTPAFISAGATAAIYWHLKEIGAAQNLQTAQTVLKEVSGLGENSNEAEMILSFYSILSFSERTGFDEAVGSIITAASKMRQKPGII
jgi:mannitol-1-phosphate 5-dehydrogenase